MYMYRYICTYIHMIKNNIGIIYVYMYWARPATRWCSAARWRSEANKRDRNPKDTSFIRRKKHLRIRDSILRV